MGGSLATQLHFIRPGSGAPVTESSVRSEIHASSTGLGWDGVVAERGTTPAWTSHDIALAGHTVFINLDSAPLRIEVRGERGFRERIWPPGTLVIMTAGVPMSHRFDETARWGAVELSPERARRAGARDLAPVAEFGTVDHSLAALVRSFLLEVEGGSPAGRLLIDDLTMALVHKLTLHSPGQAPKAAPRGGIGPQRLNRVKEMIEGTMASVITVEDLAAVAGLSPAHFARAFKRETRETPHAFVMRRRTERARELMASGSSIADAALGCGFADQAHLSRVFKLRFGITPGAFVRSARGKAL